MPRLMTGRPHTGLVSRVVCHPTVCIPMRFHIGLCRRRAFEGIRTHNNRDLNAAPLPVGLRRRWSENPLRAHPTSTHVYREANRGRREEREPSLIKKGERKCPARESNPHPIWESILSRPRIPVPPTGQEIVEAMESTSPKIQSTASTIIRKTIAAPKTVHKRATVWHVGLDSNEHPPVLETGTLPVEIPT